MNSMMIIEKGIIKKFGGVISIGQVLSSGRKHNIIEDLEKAIDMMSISTTGKADKSCGSIPVI